MLESLLPIEQMLPRSSFYLVSSSFKAKKAFQMNSAFSSSIPRSIRESRRTSLAIKRGSEEFIGKFSTLFSSSSYSESSVAWRIIETRLDNFSYCAGVLQFCYQLSLGSSLIFSMKKVIIVSRCEDSSCDKSQSSKSISEKSVSFTDSRHSRISSLVVSLSLSCSQH